MPDDGDTVAGVQDLSCRETYVAVFENMDTVVFFNAKGYETKIWEKLANATLPSRNIEGEEADSACLCWAETRSVTSLCSLLCSH